MPAKPVLSESDKKIIKEKLIALGEESWTSIGYKKTSIKELCTTVGISIGTFYGIFPSKELFFLEVYNTMIPRTREVVFEKAEVTLGISGFTKSLITMIKEYEKLPFFNESEEIKTILAKIPADILSAMEFESFEMFNRLADIHRLTVKIDERDAINVVSMLLSMAMGRKQMIITDEAFYRNFELIANRVLPGIFEV